MPGTTTAVRVDEEPQAGRWQRRMAACGVCGARSRTVVETDGVLHAGCLHCGTPLDDPLGTEWTGPLVVVGRGGQRIDPWPRAS